MRLVSVSVATESKLLPIGTQVIFAWWNQDAQSHDFSQIFISLVFFRHEIVRKEKKNNIDKRYS